MLGTGMFEKIAEFESALADYAGAPYCVMTDCCTHAIELCLRHDRVERTRFTAFTYLSVPMTMHKLGIAYGLTSEQWQGEYHFANTRIWDSARRLEPGMYRAGQLQCLSFGYSKPLEIGHGGAILLDDARAYETLSRMRYDGRDITIAPWQAQQEFVVGYHYRPTPEDAMKGLAQLAMVSPQSQTATYPDCRLISIKT
jgi:dTDP-4-amino-4,6-dideoxygalactose transaminase